MNRSNFLGDTIKDGLCVQWVDKSFKKKSRQEKLNCCFDCQGFGGSLHTSDSITTSQHQANLVKFSNYLHYWKSIFTYILLVGHVSAFLTYIAVVLSTNKIA